MVITPYHVFVKRLLDYSEGSDVRFSGGESVVHVMYSLVQEKED